MSSEHTGERPVALITGCSSGIGLRAVPALVRQGFHVVATMRDLSRRADLDRIAGDHVTVSRLDVLDQASIDTCVGTVLDTKGRIDVLVNNAGIARLHFVEEAGPDAWNEIFATNLFGQVAVTNAVLPAMRARGAGRVVMLSSIGSPVPSPLLGVYSASKAALDCYAETLRLEAKPFGIRVHLIQPGAYRTDIYDLPILHDTGPAASPYADQYAALQVFYRRYVPSGLRDPDEVAGAIARAATGRARRLRYPVGTDAWLKLLQRTVLPWWYYERTARARNGLKP